MVFQKEPETPFPKIVSVVKVKVVPIKINVLVSKPVPITEYDSIPYPVFVDSSETVKDYFKVRKYDLLLRNDSTAKLTLNADVYENRLQKAALTGDVFCREKIIENTTYITEKKRVKGFVGIAAGLDVKDLSVMVSGLVTVQDKKDNIYLLKYEPFRNQYEIGLLKKIRFK